VSKGIIVATTNAERQAAHRARRNAQFDKRTATLQQILTMLDGNQKPMAVKLRAVAEEGLR